MDPILSCKFTEKSCDTNNVLYLQPIISNHKNAKVNMENMFMRFIEFGEIIGIIITPYCCYILFDNNNSLYDAKRINYYFYNNEYISVSRSIKPIDINTISITKTKIQEPPINISSNVIHTLIKSTLNSSISTYIAIWTYIIDSFNIYYVHTKNRINKLCKICYFDNVDAYISTCKCTNYYCCLKCLLKITIIENNNSFCPFCKTSFDAYQLRSLKLI